MSDRPTKGSVGYDHKYDTITREEMRLQKSIPKSPRSSPTTSTTTAPSKLTPTVTQTSSTYPSKPTTTPTTFSTNSITTKIASSSSSQPEPLKKAQSETIKTTTTQDSNEFRNRPEGKLLPNRQYDTIQREENRLNKLPTLQATGNSATKPVNNSGTTTPSYGGRGQPVVSTTTAYKCSNSSPSNTSSYGRGSPMSTTPTGSGQSSPVKPSGRGTPVQTTSTSQASTQPVGRGSPVQNSVNSSQSNASKDSVVSSTSNPEINRPGGNKLLPNRQYDTITREEMRLMKTPGLGKK